jgi:hypothetical protein
MLESTSNSEGRGSAAVAPNVYTHLTHRYRLLCGKCGEICYVTETTFRWASRAIMQGCDNPFLCQDCEEGPEVWLFAE